MSYRTKAASLTRVHASNLPPLVHADEALELIGQADAEIAERDALIAGLEKAMQRQANAVRMLEMSHVARAEAMMQHAQVLHDQSNATALESERQANALLTERVAELESALTVRDTEIARLETDLELARIGARRYEVARRMNVQQWKDAFTLGIRTGKPFDEIIDELRPFYFPARASDGGEG